MHRLQLVGLSAVSQAFERFKFKVESYKLFYELLTLNLQLP
jgi:hypothetical protein